MTDEEVVFTNSALHQYLQEVGFQDEDLCMEEKPPQKGGPAEDINVDKKKNTMKVTRFGWVRQCWQSCIFWLFGGDAWHREVQQLHQKYTEEVVERTLKSSALDDEDAALLDNYAGAYLQETHDPGEGFVSQMIMQMGILGIAVAYGCFRLLYMKSRSDPGVYIWIMDVFAVLLTILALLPATARFTAAGNVVKKLNNFRSHMDRTLIHVELFHKLTKRSVRLIQEMELVARGFTLATVLPAANKLDQKTPVCRQCPHLRATLFQTSRDVMLRLKSCTSSLLQKFPADVELEGVSQYLANVALEEYGQCVTLNTKEQEGQLKVVTDNYSLMALKEMTQLCQMHVSEFLRVSSLWCILKSEEHSNLGFLDLVDLLKMCEKEVRKSLQDLQQVYTLQKCSVLDKPVESRNKPCKQQSDAKAIYIPVHSLSLHLQTALRRIQSIEEELEPDCDETNTGVTADKLEKISSTFEDVKRNLEACNDCWEAGMVKMTKLANKPNKTEAAVKDDENPTPLTDQTEQKRPVPLFEMGDPIIEDQVFEAFTDSTDVEFSDLDNDMLLSEEEREKKKQEKQKAIHMLKELKSVIAVRAKEMTEREEKALSKQTGLLPQVSHDTQQNAMVDTGQSESALTDCHRESITTVNTPNISTTGTALPKDINDHSSAATEGMEGVAESAGDCLNRSRDESPRDPSEILKTGAKLSEVESVDLSQLSSNSVPLTNQFQSEVSDSKHGESCFTDDNATGPELRYGLPVHSAAVSSFALASNIAALVAQRSKDLAVLSQDTFGDDSSESSETDDGQPEQEEPESS